jgi:hypothetical protein
MYNEMLKLGATLRTFHFNGANNFQIHKSSLFPFSEKSINLTIK